VAQHRNATDLPQIGGDRVYFRRFAAISGLYDFLRTAQTRAADPRFVWQVDGWSASSLHGVGAAFDVLVLLRAVRFFVVVYDVHIVREKELNGLIQVSQLLDLEREVNIIPVERRCALAATSVPSGWPRYRRWAL
jgi:hypothetical protein